MDDRISAQLDGELRVDEAAEFDAHLAECAACRAELDATRAVRDRLRNAPAIDPPFGFYERLLDRRRRPRWMAWSSVAAVAAAWVVVVGFATTQPHTKIVPPVDSVRATLANTRRVRVDVMKGDVQWSSLRGGLRRPVDRLPGTPWESTDDKSPKAIVFEDDGTTVLVVGDVPTDQLEEAARGVDTSKSLVDHCRDAADSVVDAFNWAD